MSKYKRPLYFNPESGRWDSTTTQYDVDPLSPKPKTEQQKLEASVSKLSLHSILDWLRCFFED